MPFLTQGRKKTIISCFFSFFISGFNLFPRKNNKYIVYIPFFLGSKLSSFHWVFFFLFRTILISWDQNIGKSHRGIDEKRTLWSQASSSGWQQVCKHYLTCLKLSLLTFCNVVRPCKQASYCLRIFGICYICIQLRRCWKTVHTGYWPGVRSRWLDISQVLFCVFMDQDSITLQKKNDANIQPSWPNKLGQ